MPKALIIYASLTGNTEVIANSLSAYFDQLNVQNRVMECTQINPDAFLLYDICVVATYTWGREGELPDEINGFYDDLEKLDLSNKVYGTLGSGEELYGYFCKSADDFDAQFQKTKAIKGAEVVKIELSPNEEDEQNIKQFAQSLLAKWNEIAAKGK